MERQRLATTHQFLQEEAVGNPTENLGEMQVDSVHPTLTEQVHLSQKAIRFVKQYLPLVNPKVFPNLGLHLTYDSPHEDSFNNFPRDWNKADVSIISWLILWRSSICQPKRLGGQKCSLVNGSRSSKGTLEYTRTS